MVWDLLLLITGMVVLVLGGEALVRGASALARAMGISPLVVGLTVVAFGTSAPELAVNLIAVTTEQPELAFGNVIGSNIANIGLIVGCAALVQPLAIHMGIITREIPMMFLATLAVLVLGLDAALGGGSGQLARSDGLVLLLFFGVFLYYTVADVIRQRSGGLDEAEAGFAEAGAVPASTLRSVVLIVLGLIGLVGGGRMAVVGATGFAQALGVSEVIIGLTIVAVGTSLPELATSLIATWRGQTDIAVGNVVGSNIFNLLFVLGLSSSIRPVPIPAGGMGDLIVMAVFAAILLPFAITHRHRVVRLEGAVLLVGYLGYVIWRSV